MLVYLFTNHLVISDSGSLPLPVGHSRENRLSPVCNGRICRKLQCKRFQPSIRNSNNLGEKCFTVRKKLNREVVKSTSVYSLENFKSADLKHWAISSSFSIKCCFEQKLGTNPLQRSLPASVSLWFFEGS